MNKQKTESPKLKLIEVENLFQKIPFQDTPFYKEKPKKYVSKNTQVEVLPYITILESLSADIVQQKWSLKKYLKNLLKGKFNPKRLVNYKIYFEPAIVGGSPITDDKNGFKKDSDFAKYAQNPDRIITQPTILVKVSDTEVDENLYAAGFLDGKNISTLYLKLNNSDLDKNIAQNVVVDVGSQKINTKAVRTLREYLSDPWMEEGVKDLGSDIDTVDNFSFNG